MEAVKTLASVFDRMLGHFVTRRVMGASGPADVAVHRGDCVTERWVNPVEHDQTRSVVSGGLLKMIGL